MKNPYSVLGVSENATDEQVKEAYRTLARKYQTGNYESGHLADVAAKKMQEIDEAYDQIIMTRRSSSQSTASNNNGADYSDSKSDYTQNHQNNNYYSGNSYSQYNDIRQRISQNRIDDAETLLDGIPAASRDAEWYYLKGTVQYRRGWFDEASKNFASACRLNPENPEYKAAFNNVNHMHNNGYRRPKKDDDFCDCCCSLLIADSCCECMGGDLIPCC